jgi:5-hydroxyisourate hydrolase-like protein (transthyretin family)
MRWLATLILTLIGVPALAQTSANVNAYVPSIVSTTNSTFVTDKASVPANGSSFATLTAVIRDANSNPLIGRLVAITSSRGLVTDLIRCYSGQILVNSNQAITDTEGKVVCVVTSTTVGTSTYSATCESNVLEDKPEVTFTTVSTGGGTTEEPPPPGEEPPPPVDSGPPPEPTPIQKIVEKIVEAPQTLSPIVPGGIGLAVLVPTVALLVPLGSSISIAIMAGLPALQYLLLSFLPSLRPPRKWGTVRDSTANTPVPGIFVDLMDAKTGQQIKRIMTDRTGRFGFLTPEKGKYWVEIKNALYEPYRTETFDVKDFKDKAITFDIILVPLETARVEALQKSARYMKVLAAVQIFQLLLLIGGSAVSIYMFAAVQNAETSLLIILYSLLWVLRLISSMSYRQSGHIVEIATDNAVHEAIVQVTSMRHGEQEFIHSAVSDERGRFLVLVPPGKYSIIAAKGGYKPIEKQVSGEIQNINISMERTGLPV